MRLLLTVIRCHPRQWLLMLPSVNIEQVLFFSSLVEYTVYIDTPDKNKWVNVFSDWLRNVLFRRRINHGVHGIVAANLLVFSNDIIEASFGYVQKTKENKQRIERSLPSVNSFSSILETEIVDRLFSGWAQLTLQPCTSVRRLFSCTSHRTAGRSSWINVEWRYYSLNTNHRHRCSSSRL